MQDSLIVTRWRYNRHSSSRRTTINMILKSAVIFLTFLQFSLCKSEIASVIWNAGKKAFEINDILSRDAVSWANYTEKTNQTGWAYLEVNTNGSYPDEMQSFAAGMVEGYLTDNLIYKHWINTVEGYCNDLTAYCNRLTDFLKKNTNWMKKQIEANEGKDPYWHQIKLLMYQLDGLAEGYSKRVDQGRVKKISEDILGFIMVQISGDLEDLEVVLNKTASRLRRVMGSGSCSALIKILPGNEDIYVSQDTWSTYQSMLRILKTYNFQFHLTNQKGSPLIPGSKMSFSSYPASLTSGDDFYLINSGLVTLETTIGNGNASLWKYVQAEGGVLEWMRSMTANRLTTTGEDWTKMFIDFNSGTYNNQWMIVDMKKFKPGKPLEPGLLWVVEQLPKYFQREDKTDLLVKQSYWPSYNVPYFPLIFNLSGAAESARKFGDWFSYDKTPRALIFKRDHVRVTNMDTMIKLMRYNDFTHDPLSKCNCTPPYSGENAISARSDLNPKNGTYPFPSLGHRSHGGIDMKVTSLGLFSTNLTFIAIGGPTYDSVPAFQWSKSDFNKDTPHLGHPDLWRFDPIVYSNGRARFLGN